ncbi:MAG: hypothetical protein ACI3Z7_08320, partial [Candidatus Aphodosoma sp.]
MGKRMFLAIFAMFLVAVTVDAQQLQRYFIAPGGAGLKNGLTWEDAAPSINSIINNAQGDVELYMKRGVYGPVQICNNYNITSVKIYGGFLGNELVSVLPYRDLDNPANRTVIEGFYDGTTSSPYFSPALRLDNAFTGTVIIDGLTLRGFGDQECLALRIIQTVNTIVNRCRFEGSNGSGNLIYIESFPSVPKHLAIVNSVIDDNKCTRIARCGYGMKFINTTIVGNQCQEFMNIYNTNDVYEFKNSIILKTPTITSGWYVEAYCSVADDYTYIKDTGIGNFTANYLHFTEDQDDPYACVPNDICITNNGDMNYIMPYLLILDDFRDIIGNERIREGVSIDIGAYQGPEILPAQSVLGYMGFDDSENRVSPLSLSIYPTHIGSGETL